MKKIVIASLCLIAALKLFAARIETPARNEKDGMFFGGGDCGSSVHSFVLSGFDLRKVSTEKGDFVSLTAIGGDKTSREGYPELPVERFLIEVPYGAAPVLYVSDAEYTDYDLKSLGYGFPVLPRQPSLVKLPDARRPFAFDEGFYGTDCFYPSELVENQGESYLRAHRVITILVQPIQYNPAKGTLRVYSRFSLLVKTSDGLNAATVKEHERTWSGSFEAFLSGKIINYPLYAVSEPKSSSSEGLLIITHSNFNTAALQDYAELKRKWGYKVQVATLAETGATAAQIKSYIQNAYNTWSDPPLSFVMLVGGYEFVPATSMTVGDSATKTDLYYATTSGGDILPDVHLARMTVDKADELSAILARFTNYLLANLSATAWIDWISYSGTCDTGMYPVAEGTHNYCVANYTSPWGYKGDFPSSPQNGGDKLYCITYGADAADILQRVDQGRSILTHSGHCGPGLWAGPYIYISDVNGLTNGEMTPFVVGHCCQSNQWESSTEVIGETWLKKAAIGYWGSVDYTYWDEDDLLQKYWYKEVFANGFFRVGVFTDLAKIDFFNNPGGSSLVTYYMEEYNMNGDPTVEIWTRQPSAMTVAHPPVAVVGASSFEVSVTQGGTPVAGALVCLYKPDENLHEVATTNSSGTASVLISPAVSTPGTMSLMVTKHDMKPYKADLNVIVPDGPYLVYQGHGTPVQVTGNSDAYYDRGEKWSVPVTLLNCGSESATGASAVLSGSGVTVCSPSMSFGTIASGATGTAHYEFVIDSGFSPCGGNVSFNLSGKSCAELSPSGGDESGVFTLKVGKQVAGTPATVPIRPSTADTYLRQDVPGSNNGILTTVCVERHATQARRGLIKFDLSSIPAGATINSAQLELYCTVAPGAAQTLNLHEVTSSWTETGATWTNMNSGFDSTILSTVVGGTAAGWKTWTGLGPLVQSWVSGTKNNYGVMIKCGSETGTTAYLYQFASNNYTTNTAYRPILRVNYTTASSMDCSYVGSGSCPVVIAPGEIATGATPEDSLMFAPGGTSVSWPTSGTATGYRLYRGIKTNLPALGDNETDFCLKHDGAATSKDISADDPSAVADLCYYYLVTAYNAGGESPAGSMTSGTRQVNSSGACVP